MAGLGFLINTVLNEDDRISLLFCGAPEMVFRKGVEAFHDIYRIEIEAPYDALIAGSSPMDGDFYQANKAITAASLGIRDGGTIVLVSPCRNGISDFPYFDEMITTNRDFFTWRNLIRSGALKHRVAAEICLGLRYLTDVRKIRIGMITPGIPEERIRAMGLMPYPSIEAALNDVSPAARVGIIPKGPLTLLAVAE
jgi:nickel-dependent lactate racemase